MTTELILLSVPDFRQQCQQSPTYIVRGQTSKRDLWLWPDIFGSSELHRRVLSLWDQVIQIDGRRDCPCRAVHRFLPFVLGCFSRRHGE